MLAALLLSVAVTAAAPAPANEQISGLLDQVRGLQIVLNRLDQADGPAARELMARHWGGVQDYMAALARAMPALAQRAPRADEPDCRVGGTWTPLQLPADVDAFRYRSVMHATLQRMRLDLMGLRGTADPAERALRAQAHWNATYQDLQALRGLGWLFGRWLPAEGAERFLPEPDSDGARGVARYCTQCHGVPPPTLHTALEWQALTRTMARHMERSDTPIPMCATPIPAADLEVVRDYLQRHAR